MNVSHQSTSDIPIAPPQIQRILPTICGSGKTGARPRARHAIATSSFLCDMNTLIKVGS